jgi:hypothetical protein
MNKYILIKKKDFRGENLFLSSIQSESDEHVYDIQCDETFSGYINHDFTKNALIFEEGIDFEIYKKQVGGRSVKDANGIPYDFHRYYENFAKLK